jgi:hypothetical protein
MATSTTLFQLKSDKGSPFDGSTSGISVLTSVNLKPLPAEAGFALENGFLDLAPHAKLTAYNRFHLRPFSLRKSLQARIRPDFSCCLSLATGDAL